MEEKNRELCLACLLIALFVAAGMLTFKKVRGKMESLPGNQRNRF